MKFPKQEVGLKDLELPLYKDCPICGQKVQAHPIDYPQLNSKNKSAFYCEHDSSDYEDSEPFEEWVEFFLHASVEVVK